MFVTRNETVNLGLLTLILLLSAFACNDTNYNADSGKCSTSADCRAGMQCINHRCKTIWGDLDSNNEDEIEIANEAEPEKLDDDLIEHQEPDKSEAEEDPVEMELDETEISDWPNENEEENAHPDGDWDISDNDENTEAETESDVDLSLSDKAIIAAGAYHSCALASGNGLICWGENGNGQIGDGTETSRSKPVIVNELSTGVSSVALGEKHSCALLQNGGVLCWGGNNVGQLGNRTYENKYIPVQVYGLSSGVRSISVGAYHSCAVMNDGIMKCWGHNDSGQLGDGTKVPKNEPVDVVGLDGEVEHVSAGYSHTCAVMKNHTVKCWGNNNSGQLGDGTKELRLSPTLIPENVLPPIAMISSRNIHTCALTKVGALKCWGYNDFGQLGDGTKVTRLTPVTTYELYSGVLGLATGYANSCAILDAGGVKCWGANDNGQIGNGTNVLTTIPENVENLISGGEKTVAIAVGLAHACAVLSNSKIRCWGYNTSGQLGDGTTAARFYPVDVLTPESQ